MVKKLNYFSLAIVVALSLALPAAAQRGMRGPRTVSETGSAGTMRGQTRPEQDVATTNKGKSTANKNMSEKGERNNNGSGKLHGQARAEVVQAANKKGDKDPTPSKGSKSKGKKTRTREGLEKNAKHKGSTK